CIVIYRLNLRDHYILHIPYARLYPINEDKGEWYEGWFDDLMADTGINIINARNQEALGRVTDSVVFINGGSNRKLLVDEMYKSQLLLHKVLSAKYIVAESAGSMAMGEYMRISRTDSGVMKAIGVIKNVVIEPHYTEKNYKEYLPGDMEKSGVKYGIGIDSATGIIVDPAEFPAKWEKIGVGSVYIKTAK
ncbi:hypothetical protein COY62_03390, partial [bacterium (Candidatus Howlettbacteria) CG_4_10_14_0_8_um_filter_40_9]